MSDSEQQSSFDDALREIVGHRTAWEALIWALARTHPDPRALHAAFSENAEILKSHLLYLPLSETYVQSFESARAELARLLNAAPTEVRDSGCPD